MNISAWSIRRPIPTLVLFLFLTAAGLFSFPRLGIDSTPNIDIPTVTVTVTQPGAGPTELETQVTKRVEDAIAGLGNIDELSSTVGDGVSTTRVSFVLGTNTDRAVNDVRNAISQVRQSLPGDVNEPVVRRLEFAGGPMMTYAVTSEQRSVAALSELVDRQIGRALLAVPGVAQVRRQGGVDREVLVQLDPDRLKALGTTATQVSDQLRSLNVNLPGGRTTLGGQEQTIRTLGSAASVEALQAYRMTLPNGNAVPLSSLAQVRDGFAEPRQFAFLGAGGGVAAPDQAQAQAPAQAQTQAQPGIRSVVAFSILRSAGSTLVTVEEGVRQAVTTLEKTLPKDVKLELAFTRATSIRESYQASIDALVEASALAVLTILLFLRDWRPTLITAISLPLSIIPTYGVMYLLGYTLNGMTLLALALTVGNLVDDSVVEVENIDQHLQRGKSPIQAALDSSAEIGFAVLATAATLIGVFLPVAFMGGVPGQFFQPFGVTVAVSTVFSTLVARTITPMLGAALLRPKGDRPRWLRWLPESWFQTAPNRPRRIMPYRSLLGWSLRNRVLTLTMAIMFFVGTLRLAPLIPQGLFGSGDTGLSTVSIELPPGSTLQETDRISQTVLGLLAESPIVTTTLALGGGDTVNTATIYVNLTAREARDLSQQEFEQQYRQKFQLIPGARVSFAAGGGGGSRKDLNIVLRSENPQVLMETANALEAQMREINGLVEVTSSLSLVKPELLIEPNVVRAGEFGVSVGSIARTISLATIGDSETNLPKFNLPDRQIPIRVQLAPQFRNDLTALQNLEVPGRNGQLVPLSAVATLRLGSGPAQIQRLSRSRQVSLDANLEGLSLGQALQRVRSLPAMSPLPPEVSQQPAGDARIMRDIFSRFAGALGLAVLSIYGILVILYGSFLTPLSIMMSLPLSLGGTLIALLVTQTEMGLYALIGIVLLMGLVTKNAILLVDCALENQRDGLPRYKALIEAGASRLRPIMMTSISTVAGLMPVAMGWGAGAQTRAPMAIAVIGGFTTSTLLTLVVIPVVYSYIDGGQQWLGRLFGKTERGTPRVEL